MASKSSMGFVRPALVCVSLAVLAPLVLNQTRLYLLHNTLAPAMTPATLPPKALFGPVMSTIDTLDALTKSLTPPNLYLFRHLMSYLHTVEIYTAAQLRIADVLSGADGAVGMPAAEIAASISNCSVASTPAASCEAVRLRVVRLLRALSAYGVFRELTPEAFINTPPSEFLKADHPSTLRSAALMFGDVQFRMMEQLPAAIVSGEASFQRVFGEEFWAWYGAHADSHRIFDETMTQLGRVGGADAAIANDYPWGSVGSTLVDVGGGYGDMLATILAAHPSLRGMVFDMPPVIERARPAWTTSAVHARSGVATARVQLFGGDMFDSMTIPNALSETRIRAKSDRARVCSHDAVGPYVYSMRDIVHDWPDEDVVRIFRALRAVMRDNTTTCVDGASGDEVVQAAPPAAVKQDKVVLVARVIRPGVGFIEAMGTNDADIVMLGAFGTTAGERTEEHFARLLTEAGLQLVSVTPTRSHYFMLTAVAA